LNKAGGILSANAFCGEISASEVQCQSFAFSQNGIITQYLWDMGDGTQLSGPEVTYDYGTGGSFTITHTVQNSLGQEESSSHFVNLQGVSFPEVAIQCSNELAPRVLNCEAFGSEDIIEYRWSVENVVSYGSFLNRQLDAGGLVDIELRVTNGAGLVTTVYETHFVNENTPPTANFSCESNEPWRLTCDGSASIESDFGDSIVEYRWLVGATEYLGTFIDLNLAAGDYEVTLIVTDTYGDSGILSLNYSVLDNRPPVALGGCSSPTALTLSCALVSKMDPDGDEVTTYWRVEGLDTIEYHSDSFTARLNSQAYTVSLIAVDTWGASTTLQLATTILPGELQAYGHCYQKDLYIIECDASQSYATHESISAYSWGEQQR
jgi:hypothetical protein